MASKHGPASPLSRLLGASVCVFVLAVPMYFIMPAFSQDFSSIGGGELTATSYETFENGEPMAVELLDDSELNTRLRDDVRDNLKALGRTVDPYAGLILYISTEITGRDGTNKSGGIGKLYGNSETGVDFSLNIYSDSSDSLLNGKKESKPGEVVYRLNGEVRRGSDILWQGRVTTKESLGDTYRTFKPLVQTLVDGLGETEVPEEQVN